MKIRQQGRDYATRIMPLLRTIRREIRERTRRVASLEQRLEAFDGSRHVHRGDVSRIEAELSTERRELRHVERELVELGCKQDQDSPLRIVIPTTDGDFICDGDLANTAIRPMPDHVKR